MRRVIMERDRGLCVDCAAAGRAVIATEVHHVRPVEWEHSPSAMERLMFDPANLVCLCHACHRRRHAELRSRDRRQQNAREQRRLALRFDDLINPHGASGGIVEAEEPKEGGAFFSRGGAWESCGTNPRKTAEADFETGYKKR